MKLMKNEEETIVVVFFLTSFSVIYCSRIGKLKFTFNCKL